MTSAYAHINSDILNQIAEGDENAFRILFDTYRKKIYSFGFYLTRSEFLAEELVQEVFYKVWVGRRQLGDIEYPDAWLKSIARNIALNHLKRIAHEKLILAQPGGESWMIDDTSAYALEVKQLLHLLQQVISKLPPQQKKVYYLSRQQGMKNQQIADALGISVYTVKEYLKDAMHTIRRQMEDHVDLCLLMAFCVLGSA